MFNIWLAGDHLYGKWLFTWLPLVMSLMVSEIVLSFFHEMSWMRSGTKLSQFPSIFLLTVLLLCSLQQFVINFRKISNTIHCHNHSKLKNKLLQTAQINSQQYTNYYSKTEKWIFSNMHTYARIISNFPNSLYIFIYVYFQDVFIFGVLYSAV